MTELVDSQSCTEAAFAAYRKTLSISRKLHCRILSDSMAPLIHTGETVTIVPVGDPLLLKPFDIVVFLYGDLLYCHFVWALWKEPPSIQTRSLRNRYHNDLPTEFHHILGRVEDVRIPRRTRFWIVLTNLFRKTS